MASRRQKLFICAGLAVGGLAALAFAVARARGARATAGLYDKLPAEVVIKVLKAFRKEFFVVFRHLADSSATLQAQVRSRPYYLTSLSISELISSKITDNGSEFEKMVLSVQKKVYAEYQLEDARAFEQRCRQLKKEDPTVLALLNEIKDKFKKALMGVVEDPAVRLPDFLTPLFVLELYQNTTAQTLERLLDFVREFRLQNRRARFDEKKFQQGVQALNLAELRSQMLEAAGLGVYEDAHPQQLLEMAVEVNSKTNPHFRFSVQQIKQLNNEIISDLHSPLEELEKAERKLKKLQRVLNKNAKKIIEVEENPNFDFA